MKEITRTFEEFNSKVNEGLHPKLKKAQKAIEKGETVYGENIRFPGRFKILKIDGGFATVDYQDGTEPFDMAAQNIDVKSIVFESAVSEKYDGTATDFKYEIQMAIENELGISPVAIKAVKKKGKGFEVRMSSYMSNPDAWRKLGDAIGAELKDFKKGSINIGIYESKEETVNEANTFYLIGTKEVDKDELLSYMYSNPKKPVAKSGNGWPKWMYTSNDPDGKLFKWSTIKKKMKDLEKHYGEGNVVVPGSTRMGTPYIEIYRETQFEGLSEANKDGTISDDEDERRDQLEYEVYHRAVELVNYIKEEAEEIGGPFRSPGIINDCLKQVSDAFKKNKMRLR